MVKKLELYTETAVKQCDVKFTEITSESNARLKALEEEVALQKDKAFEKELIERKNANKSCIVVKNHGIILIGSP